ncbi:MAG: leucine-rich repeat domain-containing protein, partial [bacterium]|nr:leucine-rich repeat domain-containing protein [bacterium]
EVPSIEAQLINSSDVVQDLTFTISSIEGTSTGTFSDSALPAGYYVLSVKLLDNNIQTMGAVEIVRIVEGATSTGSFIFNEINKPGGTIIANILADMEEPIEVSMSDIPAELAKGTTTEVTASVPDGVGDVRYTWFINGEQQHIGSTADPVYTIPVDTLKTDGVYRIDLVAFTLDGKRGGSATDTFRVTEADPGPGCTENVYDGDYTIMTQDDIDALSGYTKIAGNLLIGDVEAAISGETPNGSIPVETYFTDLAGLECLTHIEGYLGIANNNALTSLTGLNNLKNIDGAELESEYGDINLVTIRLMYNSVLTNIDELNNLPPVCGSMMILGNASLTNLDGLSNLTTVTGYFAIDRNMSLANIDGLANLTTISDYLYIGDNRPLTNLDGFNNLGSIGKALTITSSSLTTLNGFNNLTTIGQSLGIRNNSTLTNIEGFNSLTSVGRSLSITGNDVLTNIDGFNSLCSVANSISISYNDELCENTAEALRDQVLSCPGGGSGVSGSISDNKICP